MIILYYHTDPFESQFSNEHLVSNERQVKSDCFPNVSSKKLVSNDHWVQMSAGPQSEVKLMRTRMLIWGNV